MLVSATALVTLGVSVMALGAPPEGPCVTVGRAAKPVATDGRMSDGEWDAAVVLAGFVQAGGGAVAQPGTAAYLQYDDRALYVAVCCDEPDGDRPFGFVRQHDDRAFEDDAVQVFVAPEDLRAAERAEIAFGGYEGSYGTWYQDIKAYYEFTVNCRGSRTEARNDVRDWDGEWGAAVGRYEGGWIAELAIPFASLGRPEGIAGVGGGEVWGLNIFRLRQPDAMGWHFPPFGGYRPLPLGAMLLAGGRPVVRQEPVRPPGLGANALAFAVGNPGDQPARVSVTVTPSGGAAVTRVLEVVAAGREVVRVPYELAGQGGLRADFEVKAEGVDVPLLAGTVPLAAPVHHRLWLRYYSVPAFVEGDVHLSGGASATAAVLTLRPQLGEAVERRADLAGSRGVVLRLPVEGAPGATFEARLQALDAAGVTVAERTLSFTVPEKPGWLGTKAGLPLGVLPPWTPMRLEGRTVAMLGKRVAFGELALPASVESVGAEMLTGPMRLVVEAGGREVAWGSRELRIAEAAEDHVKVESLWRGEGLELLVTSSLEYDGFSWNEVRLSSAEGVAVDRVALEIPLREEVCRYVYQGHAQAAHALSPLGLRRPAGDNLWVGDDQRGLAWLTESLEWVRATDRKRQVEVLPEGEGWVWRTTFVDGPVALSEPYEARFALHITPAKPVSLRKSRIFHGAYYGLETAAESALVKMPAAGNLDLSQGTLECWVRPTFDTREKYDEAVGRHLYNRMLFDVTTAAGEALILYYNADDRSMRAVTRAADGTYPVCVGGPAPLPPGEWSYVGLSWGDGIRLRVNEAVADAKVQGSVKGGLDAAELSFDLASFEMDELRMSACQRPLDGVPAEPFEEDGETLLLEHCEALGRPGRSLGEAPGRRVTGCRLVEGRFGHGFGSSGALRMDRLAEEGKRIVIFHETWSRYQGYPDLAQVPKLKPLADACHARGMLFLVYFNQHMSDAAPEWQGMSSDLLVQPEWTSYHREDVKQDCWGACVNGPYGDLLLDGIARLADEAGIDGVYMDGTTVPWHCANPTHPGCGEYLGDGTYRQHVPLRATRQFMKRLRSIFAQRRKVLFLDAHTGGAINVATQSFCDGYYDGEQLSRYKPGFRLAPDVFLTAYMGKQFGFRGDFLPNRHTMDEALAVSLVHDTAVRGQPAAVDLAWAAYEDAETRFIPYWERSPLYSVAPEQVLGSLYLKANRALLVLGSQTEETSRCEIRVEELLRRLPRDVKAQDAITGERVAITGGRIRLKLPGRSWRMMELVPKEP